MAWDQRNHQHNRCGDGYIFPNKNQPDRGKASPSGVEMQMEVDTGTRRDESLPKMNQLLTALSSVEFLVKPAKQELELLNTKLLNNGCDQDLKLREKETKAELEKLRQENETMIKERNQLEEMIRKHKENIKPLQEKYKDKITELIRADEVNENLRVNLDSTKKDLDQVTQECSSIKQMLSKEKDDLRVRLRKAEAELSDTKSRLSKIMGQKLSDNNPNIADLSDTNRPTKLAERYQELYDNQWTDAFEVIEKCYSDEKKCIGILLYLLKDVKQFCEDLYETQMQEICKVIHLSEKTNRSILSDSVNKQMKDFLKGTADISVSEIQKVYCKNRSTIHGTPIAQVRPFIDECITICWLMSVQDPPVVLGKDPPPNSLFDTNFFKHYTMTGTEIDYVVWPSLYLHEGGPLLGKGVVQAKASQARQRSRGSSKETSDRDHQEAQINNDGKQQHGKRDQLAQAGAYGESRSDPRVGKEGSQTYSRNVSKNGAQSVPRERDQDTSSTCDKFTADKDAIRNDTALTTEWLMRNTKSGASTIGAGTGGTNYSQQRMNLAQTTRLPGGSQQMTGVNRCGQQRAAWPEYSPNADDLRWFDICYMNPDYNKSEDIIKIKGLPWYQAFLRYKEIRNNGSFSDV
ncbi:uncharacterized protein LOC128227820 [Mya arenaria]|uniref:uncharacterized protein LOC128227820 n=1 Tax=Mya arenaria TaxID=6604 RepID=UPI0022E61D46|nr:uncharacterized protein LOC128227820 [Mya arenaria]XP_052794652.1 uncharacterized protein LOC128227820 [Mya arenaria]